MKQLMKTMDGNEAAAYASYAFTEVSAIYPITPSSPMAEHVDEWVSQGKKNVFGQTAKMVEMQSEAGAAGALHGALESGALGATYTSSQGLLLMIPTIYRMVGQLKPAVLHVAARTVGTHSLSIFGDHSDVMACRQTGAALLSSGSVQEVMDLAGVAHLSAIKGRIPFLHFFDGFRTSHEIQKVSCIDYEELAKLIDQDALEAFRKNSLNPERPVMRSVVENPDIFFQARESSNPFYLAMPDIVQNYMDKINELTGRNYKLFNYYGVADAEDVIIAMGSVSGALQETVDALLKEGRKVGFLQVHLYRPFSAQHFLQELPKTVKRITVLDRTKEPGAVGEPLYEDVSTVLLEAKMSPVVLGGRYGLSSKDVTPGQMMAVFENMASEQPKNHFTVGIEDDITFLSLPVKEVDLSTSSTKSCKFWGFGSDGTVGANKNSIKIIGDNTSLYVQAYFEYDAKKSGGVTKSHLRFGTDPIRSTYYVKQADFVACHKPSYVDKYDMVSDLKEGGIFLLNAPWGKENLEEYLPSDMKRGLAEKKARLYIIDATSIAKELGLGNRTNSILQSAFFKLANIIPIDEAVGYMEDAIKKSYGSKGDRIVHMNVEAVKRGITDLEEVVIPESWLQEKSEVTNVEGVPEYVKNILIPMNALEGDNLPVSKFVGREDGTYPMGMSAFEKRGIAVDVPSWDGVACLQCNQCSYVCPHAAIRPFLLTPEEVEVSPEGFESVPVKGMKDKNYNYRIQVSMLDCTGCGNCVQVCPATGKALKMTPFESHRGEEKLWEHALTLSHKENPMNTNSVKGTQFEQPLLEFSGACAGCGETPYMKLMTQMFGERMIVANATGCTQAWGGVPPGTPYTVNKDGFGPAWSNSLFENNAEFSLGMCLSVAQQREAVIEKARALVEVCNEDELLESLNNWLATIGQENEGEITVAASRYLESKLKEVVLEGEAEKLRQSLLNNKEHFTKKSMWMYGGDGWAYDIGYGGLDHVVATGVDVNILIVDTEVYSNTGGQSSKATPIGATAQFASAGKTTNKKDLGAMLMAYNHVYVAKVAMGANPTHLVKVLKEAESFPGPSVIIAYAPCINHGIQKGMGATQLESKLAVESGYWHLYRYDPRLIEKGENPFRLDSSEPKTALREFLMGEVRYASLTRKSPDRAETLFALAEKEAKRKYELYKKLASS